MYSIILLVTLSFLLSPMEGYGQNQSEVSGLIIPRDNEGMYVRNEAGQFEVNWTTEDKGRACCQHTTVQELESRSA